MNTDIAWENMQDSGITLGAISYFFIDNILILF